MDHPGQRRPQGADARQRQVDGQGPACVVLGWTRPQGSLRQVRRLPGGHHRPDVGRYRPAEAQHPCRRVPDRDFRLDSASAGRRSSIRVYTTEPLKSAPKIRVSQPGHHDRVRWAPSGWDPRTWPPSRCGPAASPARCVSRPWARTRAVDTSRSRRCCTSTEPRARRCDLTGPDLDRRPMWPPVVAFRARAGTGPPVRRR